MKEAEGLLDGTMNPQAFWEEKKKEMEERLGIADDDEEFEPDQVISMDDEPSNVQDEL